MKMRVVLLLCGVLALTVGVATANGGNSENAKLCQNGGWQDWVRADSTHFKNQGDCVSYAAQGGILESAAQALCESLDGTFGGPVPENNILWTCNGWLSVDFNAKAALLSAVCAGGVNAIDNGNGTADFRCSGLV